MSLCLSCIRYFFFFFNAPAPTEIYTLSLHDALPISQSLGGPCLGRPRPGDAARACGGGGGRVRGPAGSRSEEHTSELQSHSDLVCRLLLEKKKKTKTQPVTYLTLRNW